MSLPTNHCLHYEVLDTLPQLISVRSLFPHDLEHCLQVSLMADAHVVSIFVENKFVALLVYRIVCEVHTNVFHIFLVGSHVIFSGETGQSISKDINPQRVNARHQHIDSQIKFQAVDQIRSAKVSLDNTFLSGIDLFELSG